MKNQKMRADKLPGCEALVIAIFEQARIDYVRSAAYYFRMKDAKKSARSEDLFFEAKETMDDVVSFFNSSWGKGLWIDITGKEMPTEEIIRFMNEEAIKLRGVEVNRYQKNVRIGKLIKEVCQW